MQNYQNLPLVMGMRPIRTTKETAAILGVSRVAVWKSERKALAKVAKLMRRLMTEGSCGT